MAEGQIVVKFLLEQIIKRNNLPHEVGRVFHFAEIDYSVSPVDEKVYLSAGGYGFFIR